MSRPQILVFRTDLDIDFEFEQILAEMTGVIPVFHYRDELKETIDSAAAFQPSLLVIQLEEDLETAKTIIEESIADAPDRTVVGTSQMEGVTGGGTSMMLNALQIGVEDFIRRPVSSSDLRDLFSRRLENRREKKATHGTLVSFISNKGGVGKSTCAVNAALELAQRNPEKVLLVDGSLQMGVCAAHLNLEPHATITDAWNQRDRLDERLFRELTTVHQSGLHLMAAPESAVEAAGIDDEFVARILLLARRTYDYVVIDTFPLFDRTIMAILDLSDSAYIIAENVVPTLKTIRGFFQLLEDVGFVEEKRRLVINRFSTYAGSPTLKEVEQCVGQTVDHIIPWDKKFVLAANVGEPLLGGKVRWNKAFNRLTEIVDSIEQDALNRKSVGFNSNYVTELEAGIAGEMSLENDREVV